MVYPKKQRMVIGGGTDAFGQTSNALDKRVRAKFVLSGKTKGHVPPIKRRTREVFLCYCRLVVTFTDPAVHPSISI